MAKSMYLDPSFHLDADGRYIGPDDVTTIHAYGCTSLTTIDAPALTTLNAHGCTSLTTIDTPALEWLNAHDCTQWPVLYDDPRGYELRIIETPGDPIIVSGCRLYRSRAAAIGHWGADDYPDRARGTAYCAAINAWSERRAA